ncbi:MAG: TonB-dependent receptor plug domain-containing protein [Polyangiaceae bacterium]
MTFNCARRLSAPVALGTLFLARVSLAQPSPTPPQSNDTANPKAQTAGSPSATPSATTDSAGSSTAATAETTGSTGPAESTKPIEVQVTAEKADSLRRSSGSGTTVTTKDIKRAQPSSSGEMLRRVNGLVVRQEDATGLRLNIGVRGLSPTRSRLVLVLEDGIPITVSPYGEPELYFSTPVERISSIEVIKGSDALIYGPQTLGGVVNFKTWAPPSQRGWTLEGEVGQRGYNKQLARYGDNFNDVRYVLQIARKQGDGFRKMAFETVDLMGKLIIPTSKNGEATIKLAAYDEVSKTTYLGMTQRQYEEHPRADTVAPNDRFLLRRYDASITHDHRFSAQTSLKTRIFGYTTRLGFRQQRPRPHVAKRLWHHRLVADHGPCEIASTTWWGSNRSQNTKFHTSYVAHTLVAGADARFRGGYREPDFDTTNGTPSLGTAESGAVDNLTSILGFSEAYVKIYRLSRGYSRHPSIRLGIRNRRARSRALSRPQTQPTLRAH